MCAANWIRGIKVRTGNKSQSLMPGRASGGTSLTPSGFFAASPSLSGTALGLPCGAGFTGRSVGGSGASRKAPSGTPKKPVPVSMRGWPVIASTFMKVARIAAITLSARNQSALQAVKLHAEDFCALKKAQTLAFSQCVQNKTLGTRQTCALLSRSLPCVVCG
jgi:hypothetical protein